MPANCDDAEANRNASQKNGDATALLYLKMMFSCVHLRPVILETANCR
jgi:hypothetical protein